MWGVDSGRNSEDSDWVLETKGSIKNSNLTLTSKILWLLVQHCLSPATIDNIVSRDRAVLMVAIVAGFEVDFAWLL